jgi:enterochelin esterase-like enzyme
MDATHAGTFVSLGPFTIDGYPPARPVRAYIPPGRSRARRLLVLFDGQNVFDDAPSFAGGWHTHLAVDRIARRSAERAPVVLGIEHGGAQRISELSPFTHRAAQARAEGFITWVARTLVPEARRTLHIAEGSVSVLVGGSSMGGLAALYAHLRHPDVFGGALCMSPSLWVGRSELDAFVARQPKPHISRIYIDCGAKEARGAMARLAAETAAQLAMRGWNPTELRYRRDARGTHSEAHWRRRLPRALGFFYGR